MKKTGILYVLHGRTTGTEQHNVALIKAVMATRPERQAIAYLEGEAHSLEQEVSNFSDLDEIVILPVLLFAATHYREDLPRRLQQMLPTHNWRMLDVLSTTKAVADFVQEQVNQAQTKWPERAILLVGHGTTHYPEPRQQLARLAEEVVSTKPVVSGNYLGEPSYLTQLARLNSPVVLPLFLTNGYLVEKIKTQLLAQDPTIVFLPTLEDSPFLTAALLERLEEI